MNECACMEHHIEYMHTSISYITGVFKVTITTEDHINTNGDSPSLMANHALSTESTA